MTTTRRTMIRGTAIAALGLVFARPSEAETPPPPNLCDDPRIWRQLIRSRIQNDRALIRTLREAMPSLTPRQRRFARMWIKSLLAQVRYLQDALDDCDQEVTS